MVVTINEKAMLAIKEIVNRGDKAVVQRKGNDVIVMEERRKIKYGDTSPVGKGKG